jgi:hypothetical protein
MYLFALVVARCLRKEGYLDASPADRAAWDQALEAYDATEPDLAGDIAAACARPAAAARARISGPGGLPLLALGQSVFVRIQRTRTPTQTVASDSLLRRNQTSSADF